jgi:hypothetical protein
MWVTCHTRSGGSLHVLAALAHGAPTARQLEQKDINVIKENKEIVMPFCYSDMYGDCNQLKPVARSGVSCISGSTPAGT